MHTSLAKKLAKKMKQSAGFTLLEILVVLTIMGFLIAMVAPRLAGISGGAVDTVCDSNQNRMVSMMSGYFEKTNRYPNKLTNIVEQTGATTYQLPAVSDDDPENGAETLAKEFMDRNHFRTHVLNQAEVDELKTLGITTVFNMNTYDGQNELGTELHDGFIQADELDYDLVLPADRGSNMDEYNLSTAYDNATSPLAVMMVGVGAASASGDVVTSGTTPERGWGEGDFLGRIVLGFGPENGLVTSGIVSNAAHCPGGIQNSDNVKYNDYNIVLPRLESTVARFETTLATFAEEGTGLSAVAYDDAPTTTFTFGAVGNTLKERTYELGAMESYQYATMCPEGHKFPADDEEFWGLDLDGDTTLD